MDIIHTSFTKGDYKKIVGLEKVLWGLGSNELEDELLDWIIDLRETLEEAYQVQHGKNINEMI